MIDIFGLLVGLHQPGKAEQDAVCKQGMSLGFNYPCPGASDGPSTSLPAGVRMGMWWAQDRKRVKVGYGRKAYNETKKLVSSWGHFALDWAAVDTGTGTKPGSPACVTARPVALNGVGLWTAVPLKVVYRNEGRWAAEQTVPVPGKPGKQLRPGGRRFAFACGTLGGHYLRGEERFAVEWDRTDDSVWYEIYSFSAPAHPLAYIGRPFVRYLQSQFQAQSLRAVARAAHQQALQHSVAKYKYKHLEECEGDCR